jgi:hypothetical protein
MAAYHPGSAAHNGKASEDGASRSTIAKAARTLTLAFELDLMLRRANRSQPEIGVSLAYC